MPTSPSSLEKLLDDIYLSNVDEAAAARLPDRLAAFVGGASCALWTLDPASGRPLGPMLTNLPAEMDSLYVQHYHRLDPWRAPIVSQPVGQAIHGAALINDSALARTPYYNEFGSRLGTFHIVAALQPLDSKPNAPVAALTVHRPKKAEAFDAEALTKLNSVLRHVLRALQVRDALQRVRIEAATATLAAMINMMPDPAVVGDGHGQVLHANAAAESLDLDGNAGLALHGADRKIAATDPRHTRRLRLAIADAAHGGAGAVVRIHGRTLASVAPFPAGFAHRHGATTGLVFIVFRGAPAHPQLRARRAMALFGLTEGEAAAALALVEGDSPTDIARKRRVKVSTVRTQLQNATLKVGAVNLRDLVAILAILPTA